MNRDDFTLDPVQKLALVYTDTKFRDAFALFMAFDLRLRHLVQNAHEPIIAQMKFAWWHDVMAKPASARPKGEPLIAAFSELENGEYGAIIRQSMTQLLDAWELMLGSEEQSAEEFDRSIQLRAAAIFGGYATMVGAYAETIRSLGYAWARAEIDPHAAPILRTQLQSLGRITSTFRPLSLLSWGVLLQSFSAEQNRLGSLRKGIRLIGHALTGY